MEYNLEYEWKSIFKLYNVRIGENYNSLYEKIEEYVKVLADILHIKLLIFLNIKEYLTEEEIDNLQKICFYKKIFLLLIESEERFVLDSSRLSENTEDPRKFNIPWVFSFCQNLRICV